MGIILSVIVNTKNSRKVHRPAGDTFLMTFSFLLMAFSEGGAGGNRSFAHKERFPPAFIYDPKYAFCTASLCSSSSAAPAMVMRPVSMT